MTDDPRYPIGRFAPPDGWTEEQIHAWRRELSEAPALLRAAVAGLDDRQLDTPYRDGGWTVRQVAHHVADSHMNAFCRFKLALTEDNPTIKSYFEARWAELPEARTLPVGPSLMLLDGLHLRWSALLEAMAPTDFERTFFHPEHQKAIPLWRNLALYAWHGRHHTAQVTTLRSHRGW